MQEKGLKELVPSQLRWECPLDELNFKTTKELEPLNNIVGQPRAIEAIRLGAGLKSRGYNIFVSGLSGTGRLSTVERILEEIAEPIPELSDYCYVNNFSDSDYPRLIKLQAGKGKELAQSVASAVSFLRNRIPKLFEEDSFQSGRRKIVEEYQQNERQILHDFDEKIRPFGFMRGQTENEQNVLVPEVFPVIDGEAVQIDNIEELVAAGKLPAEQAEKLKDLYQKFHNELFDLALKSMKVMQEFKKSLDDYDQSAAAMVINSVLDEIKASFRSEKVDLFIDEAKKYSLENIGMFAPLQTPLKTNPQTDEDGNEPDKFVVYQVNIILDNSDTKTAPIIKETTPSYTNLFGTIDRSYDNRGYWLTDYTKIKAGSILKADNGYLIVNADDLFNEPGAWIALKRVLLYGKLEIQTYDSYFQLSQLHLKPEPIDVNVKVIIIGGLTLYKMLLEYEKGFKKIFKVNAQFDYETKISNDIINDYARFISKVCEEDNLPHCTPDGVAAIIEWAVEKAGSKNKITLKFSDVADIVRESAFYDRGSKRKYINREDVKKAIGWRRHRNDMMDEKMREYIIEGSVMIDTTGERTGQINGLTILDDGLLSFGKPARITSTVSAGTAGIINIEREAEMSGAIHSKGVLIITGFIREKFAQSQPLNLTASIAFEQSYGGIDGDSASAAEIYVLMSALTGIPIRQHFAITGSVNQKGDIQPIGGVNEKIRGYYEICKFRGFDGSHGVIIPESNVNDLMLCDEVIEDVQNGNFHIYPISKIEEGFEILMGMKAGERDVKGKYPKDSVYYRAEKRLAELRNALKGEDKNKRKSSKKKQKN